MWCIFTIFQKKKKENRLLDSRIENPLNLDELPDDLTHLKAIESVLIDYLISIHYEIEKAKQLVGKEFRKGSSDKARGALANRLLLSEKKKLFERRLERVQEKIVSIQKN